MLLEPPIFETSSLLAINKPEGLASIPERDLSVPNVQRLLEAQRGERLWVIHRLDKEVSGVLLFARDAAAHRDLSIAFEQRNVEKFYTIVVHGKLAKDSGVMDRPITQFGSGRMGVDERRGKPSMTQYTVIRRGKQYTLVEAQPRTGRRHQLRVHFYAEGHAIVGDLRYGDRTLQAKYSRLMLHASKLVIPLSNGERSTIEAKPPPSFTEVIATLGVLSHGSREDNL